MNKKVLVFIPVGMNKDMKRLIDLFLSCYFYGGTEKYETCCTVLWNFFDTRFNRYKSQYIFPDAKATYQGLISHHIHDLSKMCKMHPCYLSKVGDPEVWKSKKAYCNKELVIDFVQYLAEGLSGDRLMFTREDIQLKLDSVCRR